MLSIGTPNEDLYKPINKSSSNGNELVTRNRKPHIIRSASFSHNIKNIKGFNNINNNSNDGNDKQLKKLKEYSTSQLYINYLVNSNVALQLHYQIHLKQQQQQQQKQIQQNQSNLKQYNVPLVIAGPSGSGKSTLLKRLMNEFQDCFGFSISHTTRKPRKGEQDGREYYFIEPNEFEAMIENNEFIEYTKFSNNYYGTSKKSVKDVQNSGKICILDVEIDGVKNLKKTDLNPRFVFIKPPSIEILEKRLRSRNTENEDSIKQRLDRAIEELKFGEIDGMFDIKIINDDIENAYNELKNFVVEDLKALKQSRGM